MDKDLLANNILKYCALRDIKPTIACRDAGVGKDFIVNIRRSTTTSVSKVSDMAFYLGVTTSDLVGDARASPQEENLIQMFRQLNTEGQERLLEQADDMVLSGKYIKSDPNAVDAEKIG